MYCFVLKLQCLLKSKILYWDLIRTKILKYHLWLQIFKTFLCQFNLLLLPLYKKEINSLNKIYFSSYLFQAIMLLKICMAELHSRYFLIIIKSEISLIIFAEQMLFFPVKVDKVSLHGLEIKYQMVETWNMFVY